ncbi:MAG: heme o synthase [Planctomycetota bacterium]
MRVSAPAAQVSPAAPVAAERTRASLAVRAGDFIELTKPRLSSLVLFVVFLGAWLAGGGFASWQAVLATGLVAGGANAINMFMERRLDSRMRRTWDRPLPSGRLQPYEVLAFGSVLGVVGVSWLALATTPLAAILAAATLLSYVLLYTPLKTRTTLNTHIGAIPGALPALIGWAAVQGSIAPLPWALFWIVYLWQLPHFLAIAWIHREDYARGGFKMLPSVDPDGSLTGRQAVVGAIAIIPVSLLPFFGGAVGVVYLFVALVAGAFYLLRAVAFMHERTEETARRLMRASLIYLPLILFALLVDFAA